MIHSPLWLLIGAVLAGGGAPVAGEVPSLDAETLDGAVQRGIFALLDRIEVECFVRFRNRPGRRPRFIEITGRLIEERATHVLLRLSDGSEQRIERDDILVMRQRGLVQPDMGEPHNGGPSALIAFALLSADVSPRQSPLSALLATLEEHPLPGTYSRALRAAAWARCVERAGHARERSHYQRLLNIDVAWLAQAARPNGYYSYVRDGDAHEDNSVTQFANLAMAAAAEAWAEVPPRYWEAVEHHWLSLQLPNGGWSYNDDNKQPRPSMTVAGANSLYLVLDHLYPRLERPYRRLEGARVFDSVQQKRARVFEALRRADAALAADPPAIHDWHGYNLFGLERLGIASGRIDIGGRDWFMSHAPELIGREWGGDAIADSFALIFLVFGRAPIWIQQLDWGGRSMERQRNGRALHFLTKYLSRTFEKPHRWRWIPEDAELSALEASPILYIAGDEALSLSSASQERLRAYLDRGGALFLHADLADKRFVESSTAMFERMYREQGWRFRQLPEDHKLFSCYYGREGGWKSPPPLWGLSDGQRERILLCPVDIAGAWHQNLMRFHPDLFQLMVNVRVYLAPSYRALRARP